MIKSLWKKGLVLGIIVLFVGAGVIPMVSGAEIFFDHSNSDPAQLGSGLRNIMLTGYWNPTGLMIAPFSNDTALNPDGWKGANWEDLGYDIYSFFPTPGTYTGNFEVDYQDTWNDFWDITAQIRPIAIISFGVGNGPWEIEYNARNLDRWIDDNEQPYQPTPCPPDDSVPTNYVRHSTLPVQEIADAVNDQTSVEAWVDWDGNPGEYLCEYMAYLGMWYQALHNNTEFSYCCWAAGFIHVNPSIALDDAMEATKVTIRETIKHLSGFNNPPDPPDITGLTSGKAGTEYEYTFVAVDPDDDDVYYYIEWGDGEIEEWIGPFESSEEVTVSHTWEEEGDYTIRAKAKDSYDAESDWGTLEVTMPVNQESDGLFGWVFLRGLVFNPGENESSINALAINLYYIEITSMGVNKGVVRLKKVSFRNGIFIKMSEIGLFGYTVHVSGFCYGGIDIQ